MLGMVGILATFVGCRKNGPTPDSAPREDHRDSPVASFEVRPDGSPVAITMVFVNGDGAVGPMYVSRTEVPWDVYDLFIYGEDDGHEADAVTRPSKPYVSMDRGFGHAGYPAISISARNAKAFCAWLSAETGDHYRLPTVEEWRYLCRASGIHETTVDDHAWHRGNSNATTHPIGSTQPDALGLYDVLGNAAEWCVADDGGDVIMGGSYREPADHLTCERITPATPAWNASDPQFPKSVWWLADGGFIGVRLICERRADVDE